VLTASLKLWCQNGEEKRGGGKIMMVFYSSVLIVGRKKEKRGSWVPSGGRRERTWRKEKKGGGSELRTCASVQEEGKTCARHPGKSKKGQKGRKRSAVSVTLPCAHLRKRGGVPVTPWSRRRTGKEKRNRCVFSPRGSHAEEKG